MYSNPIIDTILFIIVDVIIYLILVYFLKLDWVVGFFLSTAITFGIWYLIYYFTYPNK